MDAVWLIPPVIADDIAGTPPEPVLLASHLASIRLRTGVAAAAWQRAGQRNVFVTPDRADALAQVDFAAARVCIVGKLFLDVDPAAWIAACIRAKHAGVRLVLDICDYPFAEKPPGVVRFYEEALRLADAVTVNSARMAEMMAQHTTQPPQTIEDAILAAPRRPEFAPGQGIEQAARNITASCAPRLEARFTPWSLEATRIALRQCDLVLIPGDPADPLKSGVSSNRLAEALQAGRLPVASSLASYLPFGDSAWLGDDLVAGTAWAMAHRGEALARIKRGQALVAERLAQEAIGRQWCSLFQRLAGASA